MTRGLSSRRFKEDPRQLFVFQKAQCEKLARAATARWACCSVHYYQNIGDVPYVAGAWMLPPPDKQICADGHGLFDLWQDDKHIIKPDLTLAQAVETLCEVDVEWAKKNPDLVFCDRPPMPVLKKSPSHKSTGSFPMTFHHGSPTGPLVKMVAEQVCQSFPIAKQPGKFYCKYCYRTHQNWWDMTPSHGIIEGQPIILCGYCEHTSALVNAEV